MRTRERLADIVSAKAAQRVLDDAMNRRGLSPDSISPNQMKHMLLGPVLRDLESILPRAGLKRNLHEILATMELSDDPASAVAEVGSGDAPPPLASAQGVALSSSGPAFELEADENGGWARPAGFVAPPKIASPEPAPGVVIAEEPEPEAEIVVEMDPPASIGSGDVRLVGEIAEEMVMVPAEPLPAEVLTAAVLRFARIDSVKQVAALRWDGEVVEARGQAVELGSLGLLITSSLGLLRRHGSIRSYYLRHDRGQMFLFPVGRDTIIIVGQTDLNLGAVFTALAALEEEL